MSNLTFKSAPKCEDAPRFMVDPSKMFCSPVTIYTAKRDGSFVARCHSVPGFVVKGDTFSETVANATQAYLDFCRKGVWN